MSKGGVILMSYFSSMKSSTLEELAKSLEDILQQEHGVDGRHQTVTPSQDGFMTAADKKKLDGLSAPTSAPIATPSTGGGGGTTTPATLESLSDVLVSALASGDTIKYNGSQWVNVPFTTTNIPEGTHLYYTDARAQAAISKSDPITYLAGVIGLGYNTTNLKVTATQLNTIQDISSTSTPTFGSLTLTAGFGCNGKTPQTAYASSAPPPTGGTGVTAGAFDTAAHRDALITAVNSIITALKNNGIMS